MVHDEATAAQATLRQIWASDGELASGHEMQTEEHLIRPVLRSLGFFFQVQTAVPDATGVMRWPDYALFGSESARSDAQPHLGTSHYFDRALAIADAKIWDAPLDKGSHSGSAADRRNPNFQLDAYLRETDTRWGVLTNGRKWRLYSRDTSYRLDSYFEVDLIALLEAPVEDFKYFWLFFRSASLAGQPTCFLDEVRSESQNLAEQLSERVKERVYAALNEFLNGFFAFEANKLDPSTDLQAAYTNSLILLYRVLFALYSEAHELLPIKSADYRDTYSIDRIKKELANRLDDHVKLLVTTDNYYADLANLFRIIDVGAPELDVPQYNGGLFADAKHPFLTEKRIGDAHLAAGLDLLARVPSDDTLVFVDYTTLQVRHLGDIYEGLLEYDPCYADVDMVAVRSGRAEVWKPAADVDGRDKIVARAEAGTCYLATDKGERRATGSYYTPQHIVHQMVSDSVGQIVTQLEAEHHGGRLVSALLQLRVCDPAMGSGHFLVECVEQIARAVVRAGIGIDQDDDNELLTAKRKVVERCVFGVDPNPLAVELAKLSLWLATVAKARPLSFVDAHLICGNSLIGTTVADMGSLAAKKSIQMNLVEEALGRVLPSLLSKSAEMSDTDTATIDDVERKEVLLKELDDLRDAFVNVADLWTAKHFGVAVDEVTYLNALTGLQSELAEQDAEPTSDISVAVAEVASRFRFFHWEIAFPDVFLNEARPRGFDVVVTNPPYVSAIERGSAFTDWENEFWRRTLDSASGAFDLYIPFIELALKLCRQDGLASLITPNKFLAAPYGKALREYVVGRHSILRLIDASGVSVFEDPMVYPVITLFRADQTSDGEIEVLKLNETMTLGARTRHPSTALRLLPECLWSFLLLDDAELLIRLAETHPALEGSHGMKAIASTSTAEASSYGPEVREEHLAPSEGWRVVATGTIRPFSGDWGVSRLKHQGRQLLRPVLPFKAAVVTHGRRDLFWSKKLIFKKLAVCVEAQLDTDGTYASMNTNFVLPGDVDIYALGALLHSSLLTWVYEGYFGALRMSGGYMQFQAPQLRVLPIATLTPAVVGDDRSRLFEGLTIETLDLESGVNSLGAASQERIRALLGFCGEQWAQNAADHHAARKSLVDDLIVALDLTERRVTEPAFVLPRQSAIIGALENPTITDLAAFWIPLRKTVKTLSVTITPQRESALVEAAQRAALRLAKCVARDAKIQAKVDSLAFALYGLDDTGIANVRRGHRPPPGVTSEAEQS